MTMTTVDVRTIPALDHAEAMRLQGVELAKTIDLLRSLDGSDWSAPTDCPEWNVRRMYLHVLGACEAGASMRENFHQMRRGRAHRKHQGGPLEAGLSAVQVREREDLAPAQLLDRLATIAPATIRGRTRLPGVMRHAAKLKVDGPVFETWKLGYLIDTIYLRDLWMHRIDACRATRREPNLTAAHDGRIVADVVAEWARRHGRPFTLELAGPIAATYTTGPDAAETVTVDAVEFCRALAGRTEGAGLLATIVPF